MASDVAVFPVPAAAVKALRQFSRFFTRRIGVLDAYLGSDLSLTDVRVLYELAHRSAPVASDIAKDLGLDAGYLSRILSRFEKAGWLERRPGEHDARQSLLLLTDAGHAAFAPLQQRSRDEASALLARLSPDQQTDALAAMRRLEALLSPESASRPRLVVLRDPVPGDMGWVVQLHGETYWREYGWNQEFEALVAEIAARFVREFRPGFDKCWIAEIDGARMGAAFVVRESDTTARLRMLILAQEARGMGLGGRLVDECIAFARAKGYTEMTLWTNSCLTAARHLYAQRGFTLVASEPYIAYGQSLVGETWTRAL
ncbi:helix-turn-helix domain-containing GNAT family N-acetyltransferase [Acidovorax sp. SUPP3334]|uniref:bifunctional helix-turn-helix transcriptional regulator/GNAT family N-acetyltransferase n=1 Tax=Acidovorax sp. SUPP3334 TaxID=2920881 RepID=UPI0023DE52A7|nr:helix-turn-helix domain-containing GNAT family N-acetyltransferase [Acidovorax sp. SUPP3334]GKT26664.1 bifunctional helix-turn-helix transcriptional regulator/GNAT family N-acetyltransferase [Acidovorax sp. SUPP3334]